MKLDLDALGLGRGFANLGVAAAAGRAPAVFLEAGHRLAPGLTAFAAAQAASTHDYQAQAGLRWTW